MENGSYAMPTTHAAREHKTWQLAFADEGALLRPGSGDWL